MKRRFKLLFVFLALLLVLTGCAPQPNSADESFQWSITGSGGSVGRYIDDEAGVVCWIYVSNYKGGIDCLPISDTKLE